MGADTLINILACPDCKGPISPLETAMGRTYGCPLCGSRFQGENELFVMLPSRMGADLPSDSVRTWRSCQANGVIAYESAPELNLFSIGGEICEEMKSLLRLGASVLDVGCGVQSMRPRYVEHLSNIFYVGLDPERGASRRAFPFVQGLAEYLPFKAGSFDSVLFSSSVDHLIDLSRALREARRVLRRGGNIQIVMDNLESADASKVRRLLNVLTRGVRQIGQGVQTYGLVSTLTYAASLMLRGIPPGAIDHFHTKLVTGGEVKSILEEEGFKITNSDAFFNNRMLSINASNLSA